MAGTQSLEPIAKVRRTGETMPESLRSSILAMGHDAVAGLIELLEDEEAARVDSASEGWAPVHAAELLIELRATEAIEPLLRALKSSTPDHVLYNIIEIHLPELGEPVLEPALRLLEQDDNQGIAWALHSILSELGVRDERIYTGLCSLFESEPLFGSICLGSYGDERALPLLRKTIEQFEPDWEEQYGLSGLADYVDAYERIAGSLPDDLQAIVEELKDDWAEWEAELADAEEPPTQAVSTKIGRNEPCPCGSGKKYKKCCGAVVSE